MTGWREDGHGVWTRPAEQFDDQTYATGMANYIGCILKMWKDAVNDQDTSVDLTPTVH